MLEAKSFEEFQELRRQIQIYRKATPLYEEYKQIKRKSKQEDFYRAHESDFILRKSALRYFKRQGRNTTHNELLTSEKA